MIGRLFLVVILSSVFSVMAVESSIQRTVLMASDLGVRADQFTGDNAGLAPAIAANFDAVVFEYLHGRSGDAGPDLEVTHKAVFDRSAGGAWHLVEEGVSVIPGIDLFVLRGQNKPNYKCNLCAGADVDGFSWDTNEYWKQIEDTIEAAARYTCANDLKALYIDTEVYWAGRTRNGVLHTSWNDRVGLSEPAYLQLVYRRAGQLASAAKQACDEVEIFLYNPNSGDARSAWIQGFGAVVPTTYLTSEYYQQSTESAVLDVLDEAQEIVDAVIPGLPSAPEVNVAPWSTVAYERTYTTVCEGEGDDYFKRVRKNTYGQGRLPWFDVQPEFIESQVALLKGSTRDLFVYPGTRHYACQSGSVYCREGDYEKQWPKSLCYISALDYFEKGTVDTRAIRISDALAAAKVVAPVVKKNAPAWWRGDETTWRVEDLVVVGGLVQPGVVAEVGGRSELLVSGDVTVVTVGAPFAVRDIDAGDVYVEVLVKGNSFAFEGVPFAISDTYEWVRVARRFTSSSRPAWDFSGEAIVGGVRLVPVKGDPGDVRDLLARGFADAVEVAARHETRWAGLALQELLHGQGWSRNPSGVLLFDPAIVIDERLSGSAEILAFPGRPTVLAQGFPYPTYANNFEPCILIETEGVAKFTGAFAPQPEGVADYALQSGWHRLGGSFSFAFNYPKRYSYKLIVQPSFGTDAFSIKEFRLVAPGQQCGGQLREAIDTLVGQHPKKEIITARLPHEEIVQADEQVVYPLGLLAKIAHVLFVYLN